MLIKTLVVGQIETNCYVVTDETTLECAVIDPGDESNTILNYLEDNKLICRYVFLTHGHYDHTMAARAVAKETGAPICIHRQDVLLKSASPFRFVPGDDDIFYGEGDVFTVGNLEFRVLETPGHSPGGVSLLCGDSLFCGDTLFRDSCGRTDFSGGDLQTLLQSLMKISQLDGNLDLYPGHMDATTLDRERRFNYYMKYANGNREEDLPYGDMM